ncbi:MAG TPA: TetR/AcrR family transcriptional regulator [Pseudomonas sp.]|nr:TetR/AcrR family transcriptional regulator [Pseudomonas sp.]
MRKSRLQTAATRARIVDAARAQFRRDGIDGSGLTGLMAAAGMTQGGFYKHFESKAQLVAQATTAAVDELLTVLEQLPPQTGDAGAFKSTVLGYLSAAHRDGVSGCPYAAMGSELARGDEQVRRAGVDGFERMIQLLSRQLQTTAGSGARDQALLTLCAMMGALTVSRMAKGQGLAEELLAAVSRQLSEHAGCRPERDAGSPRDPCESAATND